MGRYHLIYNKKGLVAKQAISIFGENLLGVIWQFLIIYYIEKGIDILKNLGEDSISHIFRAILRSSDSETEVHPKDIDGYLDTLYDSVSSVQSVALVCFLEMFIYYI